MNKKVIIEGEKVHYVGYRPFLLRKARELRVPNYDAKNVKENGKEIVEVSLGGEEKQVQDFMGFVKSNYPPEAKVSEVKDGEPPEYVMPIDEYQKILDSEQHNTMVQAGLGMIKMQEITVGNQEKMLQKQDQMREDMNRNFSTLDTKYGALSEKIESMDNTLKELTKAILALATSKSS